MRKLLKIFNLAFVAMLLFANVTNAQTYDTLSVRNLRYKTLSSNALPIVLTDSLTSDSASVLSDVRSGRIAVGYKITLNNSSLFTVDVREANSYDGYLYILDSNFNTVCYNDDNYHDSRSGSTCKTLVDTGTYYIIVTKYSTSSLSSGNNGVYNMTISAETVNLTIKDINNLSELRFKNITNTTGISEWIDSMPTMDTLYRAPYLFFTQTGELVDASLVDDGSNAVVGFKFNITEDKNVIFYPIDTIDNVDFESPIFLDSTFRKISVGYTAKLTAGTYYILLPSDDDNWMSAFPARFRVNTNFVNNTDIQDLSYTTINNLSYFDTTICTSTNPIIYNQYNSYDVLLTSVSGAYKLHMNADTLYHFGMQNLDTNKSADIGIIILNSNFEEITNLLGSGNVANLDYLPQNSDDYYILSLYYSDDDTLNFAVSISKTEVPTFYVDEVNGNDGNNGTTPSTAFASFDNLTDTSAIIYLMSGVNLPNDISFNGNTNIRGYQNKSYSINGNNRTLYANGNQFIIGSKNANDTIILENIEIYSHSNMTMYNDVEYTMISGEYAIRSYGSCLNIFGTKFYNSSFYDDLIYSDESKINIKGVSIKNINADNLFGIYGQINVNNIIDSCTIENCDVDNNLFHLTSNSENGTIFNLSNIKILNDTTDNIISNDRHCSTNITNVDMINNVVSENCIYDINSQLNFYSGNIRHNSLASAVMNGELAEFNMYGGAIEDNVCNELPLFTNTYCGFCNFKGGKINDNVGINISSQLNFISNATMRNFGGIVSCLLSKITVSDSFSINHDAFIMSDSAITIGSTLIGDDFATLVPIAYDLTNGTLGFNYYENRKMLDGETHLLNSQYYKFDVAQYDTITWYIDNQGKLTSTPVGLNNAKQTMVQVYPNPTHDYLNINANDGVSETIILDMQGRVIAQQTIVSGSAKINMQNLANGVYFVQLLNKQHEVLATKKIIKK